jgi:hypothetical protein
MTSVEEEAVAFLIRQQIGEGAFVEAVSGSSGQLRGR